MMLITAAWMRFWTIWFCLELAMISVRSFLRRSISRAQALQDRLLHVDDARPLRRAAASASSSASAAWSAKKSGWAFR